MAAKDLFSAHARQYAAFRPDYPVALYEFIFQHLQDKKIAWDCATGNGQVAQYLAKYFGEVHATDISAQQLAEGVQYPNIHYQVCPAEQTTFPDDYFDLITVAQALHWIDVDKFYKEVGRVGKTGALLAVWGYGLLHINATIDSIITHFYTNIVGPYWDRARKLVDEQYETILFPFEEIETEKFSIDVAWTLDHLAGYLETWSATRGYIQAHQQNPVTPLILKLRDYWKEDEVKTISFPIFIRLGKIQ
jgi:SAM-dependent methyltransferase